MSLDPDSRYLNAVEFSQALSAWHEGDLLRNKALSGISKAEILENEAIKLRSQAKNLQIKSERKLSKIPAYAEESVKATFWNKLETSFQLNQQAELKLLEAEQVLRGSLIHAPDLPETHAALARCYQAAHRIAEQNQDEEAKLRLEIYLQDHTNSLPQGHPAKQYYERYLTAQGEFTLHTEPQGAEVTLYQFETQNRRLVPVYRGLLGYTPINRYSVPIGSYLLKIVKPGYCTFNYPIQVERQKHWDGMRVGETELSPLALPPTNTIGSDEILVPEGWSRFGGDENTINTISKRRLWVDSFVITAFPVSNAEYLHFLNDLVQKDRNDDALKCVPRERSAHLGQMGDMNYEQDFLGAFSLPQESENARWLPNKPVTSVNWNAAMMYAAWKSEKTGVSWRLPSEWEWEKAARGVDGRHYPWGNELDPSWCCMRLSHQDKPAPADIDSYPIDKSVYGVRGMSGNVRDWCLNIYTENIPWSDGESIEIPDLKTLMADEKKPRLVRGGSWMAFAGNCRSAFRFVTTANFHGIDGGFRLVRTIQ
jgi:serine/threonine-protein kinase